MRFLVNSPEGSRPIAGDRPVGKAPPRGRRLATAVSSGPGRLQREELIRPPHGEAAPLPPPPPAPPKGTLLQQQYYCGAPHSRKRAMQQNSCCRKQFARGATSSTCNIGAKQRTSVIEQCSKTIVGSDWPEMPLRHASNPCDPFSLCASANCCVPGPP